MSNAMVFKNPSFGSLRVVKINGDLWFVAKDVCGCLGLSDVSVSLSYLNDDEKGINIICTPDGDQEMATVSDFGLYALIQRSCSPNAEDFRRWVTREIIPFLRRPGPGLYISLDDPAVAARAWADAVDREKAERAEKEKAQAALKAEQAAHLDTKRKLAKLNDKYSAMLKAFPIDDAQSAYDMQPTLKKYFDTDKCLGGVTFWWYMTAFMRAYCSGGIYYNNYFALPVALQGHSYCVTRRDDISVFDMRAWVDVIVYFEQHKDSLKDLPCIGYAAR